MQEARSTTSTVTRWHSSVGTSRAWPRPSITRSRPRLLLPPPQSLASGSASGVARRRERLGRSGRAGSPEGRAGVGLRNEKEEAMNADAEQQGRPRALGELIEYAPNRWVKASAVIAIEPIEGSNAGSPYQSAVTLL